MLGEFVRSARRGKGWTRGELAARIGIDPQVVKRLETGTAAVATLVACMRETELHLSALARGATIVEQIGNARRARGWSLDETAERAGIARGTLSALERGGGTIAPLDKLLTILAPNARPAKPVRTSWNYDRTTDRDKRFTPAWFFEHVVTVFGPVDLDPCGHELSPVQAKRRIMLPEDGLAASWAGARFAFVNPPFSNLVGWLNRAVDAFERGECEKIVVLIPTRTDSSTFHDRVVPLADIGLLRGRMKFEAPEGPSYPAPFAMMLLAFGATKAEIEHFTVLAPAKWLLRPRPGKHAHGEA